MEVSLVRVLTMLSAHVAVLLTILADLGVRSAAADDWPQFLGVARDGVSSETGLHLDWREQPPPILWRTPLGPAFSSVACVGERLFTLAQLDERAFAVCLQRQDGSLIWSRDIGPAFLDQQNFGEGPRATPTWQAGRLYCLSATGDLWCLSAQDGSVIWSSQVLELVQAGDHAELSYYWGLASSPLVEEGLVIVQTGGNHDNSLVAVRATDGSLAWRVGNDPPGYGSPRAITAAGRRQVVCTTGQSIVGVGLPDGELLWRYVWGNIYNCNCATPQWDGQTLYVSSAYDTGAVALELSAEGDQVVVRERWRNKNLQTQFATGILFDGRWLGTHGTEGGFHLRAVDQAKGELLWRERQPGKTSWILVEGHLVGLEEEGPAWCYDVRGEKPVLRGELATGLGPRAWAAPALSDGRLYLRDGQQLIAVDLKAAKKRP